MKKILSLLSVAGLLFLASSCKKTGDTVNPLADFSTLEKGVYLTLKTTNNLNLNFAALASSSVGITVEQKEGTETVTSIIVYAVKGASSDTLTWKRIKTVPFVATGTTIAVTGAELASGLGVALNTITPGTQYTFYNRLITSGGRTFDVSNTSDNNGGGLVTGAAYQGAYSFTAFVVCPFVQGTMAGAYRVVYDGDWADWSTGDIVQVTQTSGQNQLNLSQVWPNAAFGNVVNPLLVNVDPATGTATVPSVNFANYGGGFNMTAIGSNAGGNAGYCFSCTGLITLRMNLVANGPGGNGFNNGPSRLILQKL